MRWTLILMLAVALVGCGDDTDNRKPFVIVDGVEVFDGDDITMSVTCQEDVEFVFVWNRPADSGRARKAAFSLGPVGWRNEWNPGIPFQSLIEGEVEQITLTLIPDQDCNAEHSPWPVHLDLGLEESATVTLVLSE